MSDMLFNDDLAADRPAIEPVEIVVRPEHSYVKPPKGKKGCRHVVEADTGRCCNAAQFEFIHNLPSLNELGIRSGWFTMDSALKKWRAGLTGLLIESGLPRDLDSVLVEGRATFPTRNRRDQGNHRYFLEKALGDALVKGNEGTRKVWLHEEMDPGGWLPDDDWSRYEFGNLSFRYERGVREVALRIFPNVLAAV